MELPTDIKPSPTKIKLLEIYPKGSSISREEIGNAYILLSKSMFRLNKTKEKGKKRRMSIPATRRWRGVRFFKEMVKKGYWFSKD